MKLKAITKKYVTYRKSFGESMKESEKCLKSFCRFMGSGALLSDVSQRKVKKFLYTKKSVTKSWLNKHSILTGFYFYVISRGYCKHSPLPPRLVSKVSSNFTPYIFTRDELRKIFKLVLSYKRKTKRSRGPKGHLSPYMLRVVFILLYCTGLRLGEALSLRIADVHLSHQIITVKESKFHKSRLVPFGNQLADILEKYSKWRKNQGCSQDTNEYFFITASKKPLCKGTMLQVFRRTCKMANIQRNDNAIYQPRIHDLRHTFAVHRLTNWYQKNVNVQMLLPALSTYLGHESISATSRYLTMTDNLLIEAGSRFEKYARGSLQ